MKMKMKKGRGRRRIRRVAIDGDESGVVVHRRV